MEGISKTRQKLLQRKQGHGKCGSGSKRKKIQNFQVLERFPRFLCQKYRILKFCNKNCFNYTSTTYVSTVCTQKKMFKVVGAFYEEIHFCGWGWVNTSWFDSITRFTLIQLDLVSHNFNLSYLVKNSKNHGDGDCNLIQLNFGQFGHRPEGGLSVTGWIWFN